MDFTLSAILIVVSFVVFYIYNSKQKRKSNLPGPKGYPLVGNIFDVDFKELHLKLFQWGKTYGDIFQINLFGKTFVIVNSSEVLRELFLKEPNATLTSARPDTFARRYLLPDVDVSFTSLDKEWIQRKKLLHKLIRPHGEGLQHLETEVTATLTELRKEISKLNQRPCDPQDLVDDYTLSILELLAVGRRKEGDRTFHEYMKEFDDAGNAMANPGVDTLYNSLPFLRFLPLPPTKMYRRFITLRDGLMKLLDEHSESGDGGIYSFVKKIKSEKLNDDSEHWLTETVMQSLLINILAAGYLSTKSTMLSLIRILMTQPRVQIKLQEEVDRVVGHKRQPCLNDRSDMPYHEAVILETLRFISHIPSAVLHSASDDVFLGEYIIPKGTFILTNLWAMHHSDKEWEDPFDFIPERFLNKNGDFLPADHDNRKRFVDFGLGKRSCVGETFAKSRIFLFLCTLMQVSTVLPPDGENVPMMDPTKMTPGIAMVPLPFTCRFMERHLEH